MENKSGEGKSNEERGKVDREIEALELIWILLRF